MLNQPLSSFQKANLKKANSLVGIQPLIKTVTKKQFVYPSFVKAKSGSVVIPDLKLTVGQSTVDLHAMFGAIIPQSKNLQMAITTGLIIDASSDKSASKLPDLDMELDKPKIINKPVVKQEVKSDKSFKEPISEKK